MKTGRFLTEDSHFSHSFYIVAISSASQYISKFLVLLFYP